MRTERLLMRRWRADDLAPFADLNADPIVKEHFPETLSRAESDVLARRIEQGFDVQGYGLWALELPGEAPFIGFTGLMQVRPDVAFAPAVEVGWRLARPFWGRGLASEAARTALSFAFEELDLRQLVAYTHAGNLRSRRVMERLGMARDPADDFAHPALASEHRLSAHVVYRIGAERWRANKLEACAGATPTLRAQKN
jgi:RimJ/RimL family protein N-acetyltransferase